MKMQLTVSVLGSLLCFCLGCSGGNDETVVIPQKQVSPNELPEEIMQIANDRLKAAPSQEQAK